MIAEEWPLHLFLRQRYFKTFMSLIAPSVTDVKISCFLGYDGTPASEMAQQLAKISLGLPFLPVALNVNQFLRSRFRSLELHRPKQPTLTRQDFDHLKCPWFPYRCLPRAEKSLIFSPVMRSSYGIWIFYGKWRCSWHSKSGFRMYSTLNVSLRQMLFELRCSA